GGTSATFSITDGGLGDDDLTANGSIVDQGGPGNTQVGAIPTLSAWSLAALSALLAALALALRRRKV
ncbi:MAG: IPTL-CTERM sorting domain-containing protein, partial [Betaproteobacteria bacterium]|nr:IPTL-CTERM sorting domain-containing protein [Betaproteobacteria bacterium]